MKPALEEFKKKCPGIDEGLIREHLSRLDDRYFARYNPTQIAEHLLYLSRLNSKQPVHFQVASLKNQQIECTLFCFDYPFLFSLLTGILGSSGFNIVSGDIFTYKNTSGRALQPQEWRRFPKDYNQQDPLKRKRIVDYFAGKLESPFSLPEWSKQIKQRLQEVIQFLEDGREDAITHAKHRVCEMVDEQLEKLHVKQPEKFSPVQIYVDNQKGFATRFKIISQDSPFFLYTLSNALSLQEISIQYVNISTEEKRVADEFEVVDLRGQKIIDDKILNQMTFSVLLTKQFGYFLSSAPDPYLALIRFEQITEELLKMPQEKEWRSMLSDPKVMSDLARLLGTSDFLWEDFIRLNYESLLPVLSREMRNRSFVEPLETLPMRIQSLLDQGRTLEEKKKILNEFKNREIFLIDLDHILGPSADFRILSERLTLLAEAVVNAASDAIYQSLLLKYGQPQTVAGLWAPYSIVGLGKFGGAALGYASDIELMFIYSDQGKTQGPQLINNSEFYEEMIREFIQFIQTKRDGIFNIDLRLRPFGAQAGPLACSLETFCSYYGPQGRAHSYEKLSLIRLRAVGGDRTLAQRVERLRDEIIYTPTSVHLPQLRELREKQLAEKTMPGQLNAKFSPGGLVDLEYDVQILQLIHGVDNLSLRTPRIHKALTALKEAGVLEPKECEELIAAYDFLRKLINGLRMLRGSAKDLFLPRVSSPEYLHLARRMGYVKQTGLSPAQLLNLDFEAHTALIRAFVEHHFGRKAIPGPEVASVADLVLSDEVSESGRQKILAETGFKNGPRAYVNVKKLAGQGEQRLLFSRLAILAFDFLKSKADPDMALNNWERFTQGLPDVREHYHKLLSQPMRIELLMSIFAGSQFLADTLIRHPDYFDWITDPQRLNRIPERPEIEETLRHLAESTQTHPEWLNTLRLFRRKEFLRIATKDIGLGRPFREVTSEISTLADAILQIVLEYSIHQLRKEAQIDLDLPFFQNHFCLIALGKLGGQELNYSSDIDLIAIYHDSGGSARIPLEEQCTAVIKQLRSDLSGHTEEGFVYRIDFRLRPYGQSGQIVYTVDGLKDYYLNKALLWEKQAFLKARPVAGNRALGEKFLTDMQSWFLEQTPRLEIVQSIEKMRDTAIRMSGKREAASLDIKNGKGGIRDIEFLVQGLQLMNAPDKPTVLHGNTLTALHLLEQQQCLEQPLAFHLSEDYIFLRRVEHFLQLLEDRQTHQLPSEEKALESLGKRMLGAQMQGSEFMQTLRSCMERVSQTVAHYLNQQARAIPTV